jgi:hypothetical protein
MVVKLLHLSKCRYGCNKLWIGLIFDDAKVVHHDKTVTNGPFGEIKETLGGYVVVQANSADEAVEFAKLCPVLQGEGNTVEVRQLAKNDGVHS